MFLHVSVCPQGGVPGQVPPTCETRSGGSTWAGTPWDQVHPPTPGTRYPWVHGRVPGQVPPVTRNTPHPWYQVPPMTRYTPYSPGIRYTLQDQVHPPGPGTPPRTRYTHPGPGTPPETATVADGTHSTGMHSC